MDVGPMGLANVIHEALPTVLVQLGQVRLVLSRDASGVRRSAPRSWR